jgi:hypothetical protein
VVKIALDVGVSLNRRNWIHSPHSLAYLLTYLLTCLLSAPAGLTPSLTRSRTSPARTTSPFLWLQAARHPRLPF